MHINTPLRLFFALILSFVLSINVSALDFVIANVKVFDGYKFIDSMQVEVFNGRITKISRWQKGEHNNSYIDGSGKTLLPGFIDCHVHARTIEHLMMSASFGVTTQLDMFAPPGLVRDLKEKAKNNFQLSDIRSAIWGATVPKGHATQFYSTTIPTITRAENADSYVKERIDEGSDYLKLIIEHGSETKPMPTLSDSVVQNLIIAAHKKNILAVGHVSRAEDVIMFVSLGGDGLAHMWKDDEKTTEVISLINEKKVFIVPTMAVYESLSHGAGPKLLLEDKYLVPYLTEQAKKSLDTRYAVKPTKFPGRMSALKKLVKSNAVILAGTDAGNPGTYYGVSLHRELELLVQAGLSPLDALKAATSSPAEQFNLKDKGVIRVGALADLILIDGDPETDIYDTRKIESVWRNGVKIERKKINDSNHIGI